MGFRLLPRSRLFRYNCVSFTRCLEFEDKNLGAYSMGRNKTFFSVNFFQKTLCWRTMVRKVMRQSETAVCAVWGVRQSASLGRVHPDYPQFLLLSNLSDGIYNLMRISLNSTQCKELEMRILFVNNLSYSRARIFSLFNRDNESYATCPTSFLQGLFLAQIVFAAYPRKKRLLLFVFQTQK